MASKAKTTNGYAKVPQLFAQITQPDDTNYLIIPSVSSERRKYVPIGFEIAETIASNAVQIVPNATLYHFGVLTSNAHGMDAGCLWTVGNAVSILKRNRV